MGAEPQHASTAPRISITGLRKSYGQLEVFDGLDLEVGESEIVSLVGPSGCGKTEAGFYDKYNLGVESRPMETGVDAARAVQGGDLDVAWSPTGPVMTFAGTGVDVTAIMGMDNIDWLVGSVNPDITSCEDLAGETIAVDSVGGAPYGVLEIILDSCGLTTDDVDAAAFPGPAAIQAIVAGQLDTPVIHIDDVYVIEEQGTEDMHIVSMLAGFRLASGRALVGAVVAEYIIGGVDGLGYIL